MGGVDMVVVMVVWAAKRPGGNSLLQLASFPNEILERSLGFEMKFWSVPYPDEKRKCSLAERMK